MEKPNLKCIIVDDDPVSKNLVRSYIDQTAGLELTGQFKNATSAMGSRLLNFSDLLFLDIEMPQMNGFELLQNINYRGRVVVMTSNPKHALNGFEWDVADFLLKPIAYDRFLRAIEKVHKLNGMIKDEEFLTISSGKTVHRLKEDEILYVEGAGEYLNVVTRSGHFLVYSNMRNMLGMLNSNFVQVHRSFIVNRKNIQVWSRHKLTVGGKEIPISKTYEQNVQNSVTHVR
jgi:DNA-binding LytR/AlgR family response regulator